MPIKSLSHLSADQRKMWESVYKELKKKGYSEEKAAQITWATVKKHYKDVRKGKKSMAVAQPTVGATEGTNYVDVMLGYPGLDIQAMNGGILLADDGWKRLPSGVVKGDYEHFYADKAEGVYTDIDNKWEGFITVATKFWHDDEGKLYARVELPENHEQKSVFLQDWGEGKYGVSIEYAYPEDAYQYKWVNGVLTPYVSDWYITGYTFTGTPSYSKTKPTTK
jgi:hypothetical protein